MKAIVQTGYGAPHDVLDLRDIPVPVIEDDEVLVRVRAASVHPDVWHVVRGLPYALRLMGSGVRRPQKVVPGTDIAGVVESVGANVADLGPGDEVFGESARGYQWSNGGAYAEFVAVPSAQLARKPAAVGFEAAACLPTAGIIALLNLRALPPDATGWAVLVNGAAGGVGSIAVQVAKARGATVTGVDATDRLEAVASLGADRVIDYTREDFTRGEERYDLIFDVPGNHTFRECKRALTTSGRYVLIAHDAFGANGHRVLGSLPRMMGLLARSPFSGHLGAGLAGPDKPAMTAELAQLSGSGRLTPLIDRTFPLAEAADAIHVMEQGLARGRIVLTV
jgi:NADPH:quinone reductase-like Zn-dependent oxidoreductase